MTGGKGEGFLDTRLVGFVGLVEDLAEMEDDGLELDDGTTLDASLMGGAVVDFGGR